LSVRRIALGQRIPEDDRQRDNTKQIQDSCAAAPTKIAELAATNTAAADREITPRGISRIAVRGLRASYSASTSRLNPIAALRAATIAKTIQPICHQETPSPREYASRIEAVLAASRAPVNANGSAKTEWLKRMKDR